MPAALPPTLTLTHLCAPPSHDRHNARQSSFVGPRDRTAIPRLEPVARYVRGHGIDSGPHVAEQTPGALASAPTDFLRSGPRGLQWQPLMQRCRDS